MCMQCAATAMVAVGTASGLRTWLSARAGSRLTARRLRLATAALLTLAVLGSGLVVGGSG